MPSCVRSINITGGTPSPNGNGATMYTTCTANQNNQAEWSTQDDETYTVTLPDAVWTPPSGATNTFDVSKGSPSGTYTVKTDASNGLSAYTIEPSLTADPPEV